jgi:hypothetical protein
MRGEAMARVCADLETMGIDLGEMHALDFFARAGTWQTQVFAEKAAHVTAWELERKYESALHRNLPGDADIRIGDSFGFAQGFVGQVPGFDLVVFDNPMGIYGDGRYCEHFEAITHVRDLLRASPMGVVICNVNRDPFDRRNQHEWMERRLAFYGPKASRLPTTSDGVLGRTWLATFYRGVFAGQGFRVHGIWTEDRNPEYLSLLVAVLERP